MTVRATLALGSNLGDRAGFLDRAAEALGAADAITLGAVSSRHETPALLPDGAPAEWAIAYLNQVVMVRTTLAPLDLLAAAKAIETALGRRSGPRWSPREIDIDILSYGSEVVSGPSLTVPHPEIAKRMFVLAPWREIDPDWRDPVTGLTVAQMHDRLAAAT